MKLLKRLGTTLFLTATLSVHCPAQSVFQVTLVAPMAGGLNWFYGLAYFDIGPISGQYQIDFLDTTPPADLTGHIGTTGNLLNLPLGTGTPDAWSNGTGNMYPDPFVPPPATTIGSPLATQGTQYNGTFQSSPAIYAALLSGSGQFHLIGAATGFGGGGMELVVTPEPGSTALLACGLILFLLPRLKRIKVGRFGI